ncbi:MAG: hypothetical protein JJ992_15470 [Planctomycetes bacterium]|nr:hypothetical protein [Planctomycetota bacterium]
MSRLFHRVNCRPDRGRAALGFVLLLSLCVGGRSPAGEVTTDYGFVIRGTPVMVRGIQEKFTPGSRTDIVVKPVWLVDDGMRRNFLSKRIAEDVNYDADLGKYETFKVEHVGKQPGYQQIDQLGAVKTISPLNEFGRQAVEVQTPAGPKKIVLMITEINPHYVKWEADKLKWEFAQSTTSIPDEVLRAILYRTIDPNDEVARMSIARFYLQTRQFHYSLRELFLIKQQFPNVKQQVEEMEGELMTVWANQLLSDLEHRRDAGQHQLASLATEEMFRVIPNLQPEVSQKVRDIQAEEAKLKREMEDALLLLGDYQAQLSDPSLKEQVNTVRMMIVTTLDKEAVPRLRPFLNLHNDDSLGVEEKLALAFSGWILGAANANTDLENTLRQWDARDLILKYLRNTDPSQTVNLLDQSASAEGVSPITLVPLLEHLPAVVDTPGLASTTMTMTGQSLELETFEHRTNVAPVKYSAALPIEYSPHHSYPLIVELRPPSVSREKLILWWKPQAVRRGYVLIAPEYLAPGATEYDYSTGAIDAIERSIRDAMRRFNIDSSRIFLSGHGIGADAAYDFGMSHPDLFAGVISISGLCRYHCKWTKDNDPNLSLYVVMGERDPRQLVEAQAPIFNRMMYSGRDVIDVEYMGRGVDDYYEEIHRIFDWMAVHRLDRNVKEIDAEIIRPNVSRFFWLESNAPDESLYTNDPLTPGNRVKPMLLNAKIREGEEIQTIFFSGKTPDRVTLWLTPDVIDFSKRVSVSGKGRLSRVFLEQDVRAMLEDFHARADRQNIARTKVVLE